MIAPDIGVVALLAEACSDRGTLLLNDGTLVGNGLGGTHVADELLYCLRAKGSSAQAATRELRGRQGLGRGGRTGTHRGGLCGSPLRAAWGSGKGQLDLHRWRGEAVEHTASVGCWKARLVRVAGGLQTTTVSSARVLDTLAGRPGVSTSVVQSRPLDCSLAELDCAGLDWTGPQLLRSHSLWALRQGSCTGLDDPTTLVAYAQAVALYASTSEHVLTSFYSVAEKSRIWYLAGEKQI